MSPMQTLAPSLAYRNAIARPRPLAPPVMNTLCVMVFPVLSDVSQRYLTAYESGRGWPSETVRSHGWRSQAYMDVFTACFRRPAPPAPAPSYQFLYLRNSRRATI